MPAPPLGPPSLIIENSTAQPGAVTPRASLPEPDAGTAPDEAQGTGEFEQGPVYPYRHAVLLQQKRRMRSNEVHYLDHPLMGVVIKLRPLVAEDLALLKQAEESGNYPPLDSCRCNNNCCSKRRTTPASRSSMSRIIASDMGWSPNPAAGFTTIQTDA